MVSSSLSPLSHSQFSSTNFIRATPTNSQRKTQIGCAVKPTISGSSSSSSSYSFPFCRVLHKSLPLAASVVLLWSSPAKAGFLSGSTGIESVPGPKLPEIDFLNRFNEANQKKYAEADARFKSSPLLKEFLERSKTNKEKNRQEIQDKYCIRGAEWGVGDCSAEGMSPEDKDKFIAELKEKAGVK
ncbi:hypothetical protein I3843_06G084600 [Carya illinoinensis]|uniref:Uncharacterized protein n=1 Tax=Carya illinoinensis TaxID=32201 RepID=A0A8T1Q9M0_CARIL|nr:uncharacterized protein LOC122313779 [Carya illinoinensis]KAG2702462.1 hypothetical protein I3760_06G090900 [Carya illinoinensis]KAG6651131.1 hypothetical protein CIPAW_06G090400 [Carya illinoinensis]KAG7975169.1 hypothetical protein I3843_06G084600 [Carya illinoinensis]